MRPTVPERHSKAIRSALWLLLRWGFVAASLFYLYAFFRQSTTLHGDQVWLSVEVVPFVAVASFAFGAAIAVTARAWFGLISGMGYERSWLEVATVFGSTQVAKYIPGNVGHHIGRMALAIGRLNLPASVAGVSLVQESVLACGASLVIGSAGALLAVEMLRPEFGFIGPFGPGLILFAVLAGLGTLLVLDRHRGKLVGARLLLVERVVGFVPSARTLVGVFLLYIGLCLLNGVALLVLLGFFRFPTGYDFIAITCAYSIAWVVGYLLPGAPGGLGVREAAFVYLLGQAYDADTLLAVSVLARISSVLADLLAFAASVWIGPARVR